MRSGSGPAGPCPGAVAVGHAVSLLAGWTALLAWCAGDPLERAFVVLLTAAPVVGGLIASDLYATFVWCANAWRTVPMVAAPCVMVLLLVGSYVLARRQRRDPKWRGCIAGILSCIMPA